MSDAALLALLARLDEAGYDFVTPTPLTQARIVRRRQADQSRGLRDVLGWSLPFDASQVPAWLIDALDAAEALVRAGGALKSAIRVSRLRGELFVHSAYPTDAADAVFLGPDSYRFADLVARELAAATADSIVDVGGGGGVGAIVAARAAPQAQVLITDVNPLALRYARINAAHAGLAIKPLLGDALEGVAEGQALVIANPPYMAGSAQTYRDGGRMHGGGVSLSWASDGLTKLAPRGRLLLYTGSAIVDGGHDELRAALETLAMTRGAAFDYRELDPDVFGEELATPAYADVERIAVVACRLTLP